MNDHDATEAIRELMAAYDRKKSAWVELNNDAHGFDAFFNGKFPGFSAAEIANLGHAILDEPEEIDTPEPGEAIALERYIDRHLPAPQMLDDAVADSEALMEIASSSRNTIPSPIALVEPETPALPSWSENRGSLSEHAGAAKWIRDELAAAFPGATFSVRSKSFSMGNDVRVRWTDGPTAESVATIIDKYAAGSFDGMNDLYTYERDGLDIPHAKYVMSERSISDPASHAIVAELATKWGVDMSDESAVMAATSRWPSDLVSHEFNERAF